MIIQYVAFNSVILFKCSKCQKYICVAGMDKRKHKFCYQCISEKTVRAMGTTGGVELFLTTNKKEITDFSGFLRFKVRGKKPIYKTGLKILFKDENKNWWLGISRVLKTRVMECQRIEGSRPVL
jgi:hypothetical protein